MAEQPQNPTAQTKLGLFLEDILTRTGWSQTQLLKMMGLKEKRGAISSIIRGATKVPKDDFLEPLVRVLNEKGVSQVTVEELRALGKVRLNQSEAETSMRESDGLESQREPGEPGAAGEEPGRPKYKLGFGYCLWAAPIALAHLDKAIPQFEVVSSELETRLQDESYLFGSGLGDGIEKVGLPGRGKRDIVSLSAAEIIKLLEHRKVDVAAVPVETVKDYADAFECIATLVDCAVGCTLIYPEIGILADALGKSTQSGIDTRQFGEALHQIWHKQHFRIGAEPGTVALDFLSDAIECAESSHGQWAKPTRIKWTYKNRDLAYESFQNLTKKCREEHGELAGIITWEPHATWIAKNSAEGDQGTAAVILKKVSLAYGRGRRGSAKHLRFVLVIRSEDKADGEFCKALTELRGQLEKYARILNEDIIERQADSSDELPRIASYFGLARPDAKMLLDEEFDDVIESLGSCHYNVHPYGSFWILQSAATHQERKASWPVVQVARGSSGRAQRPKT